MTCINCRNKIEKKLCNTAGIQKAELNYSTEILVITYDKDIIAFKDVVAVIKKIGYVVTPISQSRKIDMKRTIGLLIIIAALYMLLEWFGILNMLVPSRLAETNMGYGMLFVIGLITSVHCIAMCGGINLSQCISSRSSVFMPTALYNTGRVISYTVVGFIVGGLGSVITFSNTAQGFLKVLAGVFMVIIGINMLGIFPKLRMIIPRMPQINVSSKGPFVVGLLNGFMPCGPLQAMQIYAMSTGSPFVGALSMLVFSLGTVPLMFGLGAISSALGRKFSKNIMAVGSVLVVVLGLAIFTQGISLAGFAQSSRTGGSNGSSLVMENDIQIINSQLASRSYPDITVQEGVPVKWIIEAPQGTINGCNNSIIINEYGIEYSFKYGENIIEFTPERAGKFRYSCWMGMIRGTIEVAER